MPGPGTAELATEQRITEEATSRLAALVDSLGDAIIGATPSGTITSWNRAAVALYGYTVEEAVGCAIDMLVPEDDRDETLRGLLPVTRGERNERLDAVHIAKDGGRRDVSLTISSIHGPGGLVDGLSVIARDIGDQKRAEEALRRMSRYFDLSRDMVCTAGLDGYF